MYPGQEPIRKEFNGLLAWITPSGVSIMEVLNERLVSVESKAAEVLI
jgi:hypothetical protein